MVQRQLTPRQRRPRLLIARQLSPRPLIHVNLHWDQLSHLNLNLATIDPPILIFSKNENEIDITFSKNLSETNNEHTFRFLTPTTCNKNVLKKFKKMFSQNCLKRIISPLLDCLHQEIGIMINHSTLEYHVTNFNTFFRWLWRKNQNPNTLL